MLDTTPLKLIYCLSTRAVVSNILSQEKIQSALERYIYPIGIIYSKRIPMLPYDNHTAQENFNYFNEQFSYIFPTQYTSDEINIFSYYYVLRLDAFKVINNMTIYTALKAIIANTYEKLEVNYCINEIKQALAQQLISSNKDIDYAYELITELEAIEETHNTIDLGKQILP